MIIKQQSAIFGKKLVLTSVIHFKTRDPQNKILKIPLTEKINGLQCKNVYVSR